MVREPVFRAEMPPPAQSTPLPLQRPRSDRLLYYIRRQATCRQTAPAAATNASVIPVGAPTLSALNPSTVAQSRILRMSISMEQFHFDQHCARECSAVDTTFVFAHGIARAIPAA